MWPQWKVVSCLFYSANGLRRHTIVLHENLCMLKCCSNLSNFSSCPHDYKPSPTAPSPPRMLTMIGEPTGSTVELTWLPPLHPNGAIHYEIENEPAMTPGDPMTVRSSSSSPYFTLTLPNEFLTYNVSVAAVNTQGQATSDNLAVPCLGKNTERGIHNYYGTQCSSLSVHVYYNVVMHAWWAIAHFTGRTHKISNLSFRST